MIDFKTIQYLKKGNSRQQMAFIELMDLGIMKDLPEFSPVLTGTIPIGIDLPESDLDIIGEFKMPDHFAKCLQSLFGCRKDFILKEKEFYGIPSVVSRFHGDYFDIEIFGQARPVDEQHAYRHMLIEHRILEEKGPQFRKEIIRLKKEGYKTEPAFAKLLGINGDPYIELLGFE